MICSLSVCYDRPVFPKLTICVCNWYGRLVVVPVPKTRERLNTEKTQKIRVIE